MLFFLYSKFVDTYHFLNIINCLAFRGVIVFFVSFSFSMIVFPKFIAYVQNFCKQPIRDDGPAHENKKGTPTMGGIIIVLSILFGTLLFGDLKNLYVLVLLFVLLSFGMIGFLDDFLKISKKNHNGLPGKLKLVFQISFSFVVVFLINYNADDWFKSTLLFPVFKDFVLNLGFLYTIFRVFVITGSSNAVNLTDGLDGLVIMPIILSAACLGIFVYATGDVHYSTYLSLKKIDCVLEMIIPICALIGSCFGFLWFNIKPAEIFMGDVGSLSLGAFLGTISIIIKSEIIFGICSFLFVIEAFSVILQVYYFRFTGGKRIFKMAPIHHHFEKTGWEETKVVTRFWIIALFFGIISLILLKFR